MVTAVSLASGSAVGGAGMAPSAATPQLSDFAQSALDSIGRMQQDYGASTAAMNRPTPAPTATGTPGSETSNMIAAMDSMRASTDAALKVQGQIVQFSMATSISSSLGNNLNSFLKGT